MINLPDFSTCIDVKYLLQKMGIIEIGELPKVDFVRTRIETKETIVSNTKQLQFAEKIKIKAVPLEQEFFSVANNETLEINGVKCCIYIKNQSQGVNTYSKTSTYKFHLCNCKTIQDMTLKGRKDRYVATSRDDGMFPVNAQSYYGAREVLIHLELCKHCQDILTRNGMYSSPFSLEEFYKKYQPDIPKTFKRAEQVPITEKYAPDHAEIAAKYKESVQYRCQSCGVDCSKNRGCLHMHHVNGVGSDNKRSNLRILCVACHMEQPCHEHMNRNPRFLKDAEIVKKLQHEQGLFTLRPV